MIESLTFITGNAGKAEELARYARIPVVHQKIDLPEIQSLDPSEIVTQKAREAYRRINKPVIVEDTSLIFSALGKLPGPLIKWFLQELGNEGLCKLINGYTDRSAVAQVNFALYDGQEVVLFDGTTQGKIADQPKGDNGFGWDPIFIPEGSTKTWGEMKPDEKQIDSMRLAALQKLEAYLHSH